MNAVTSRLKTFFLFWYDFIVGDDWRVAAGVTAALAGTYGLSRAGVPAWWLVPLLTASVLSISAWRARRRDRPA